MRKRRAFTLIELLVVIAIISLLVSILLPSLSRARDLARQVVCMSQFKDVGLEIAMYVNDNEGWYSDAFSWAGGFHSWASNMRGYIDPRSGRYVCPADPDPTVVEANMGWPSMGTYSYSYNSRLGLAHSTLSGWPDYHPAYRSAKASGLSSPGQFVMMFCQDAVIPNWFVFDGPWHAKMILHAGGSNLLLADGHVDGRKAQEINSPSNTTEGEFHWGWYHR